MSGKHVSGRGLTAAGLAFGIWGLLPLYLHALLSVSALQIVSQRIAWSSLFVLLTLAARRELPGLMNALRTERVRNRLILTTGLISINWLLYVWAVGHGHVIESSLGYFINPLMNVLLGVLVLRERLSPVRWASVGLAALAVGYLTVTTGRPPWIALTLAASFSLYGLLRKITAVEALPGLATETLLLTPLAVGYLIWCDVAGVGAFGHAGATVTALLVAAGPVTAVPLVLFAYAARRIPYSTLGVMQYIAPSLQLACGVFFFHEPFEPARRIGFALIWTALALYAGEGVWQAHRVARQRARALKAAGELGS